MWRYSREELVTRVTAAIEARGREVAEVHALTTGLWCGVTLTNGGYMQVSQDEIA